MCADDGLEAAFEASRSPWSHTFGRDRVKIGVTAARRATGARPGRAASLRSSQRCRLGLLLS